MIYLLDIFFKQAKILMQFDAIFLLHFANLTATFESVHECTG